MGFDWALEKLVFLEINYKMWKGFMMSGRWRLEGEFQRMGFWGWNCFAGSMRRRDRVLGKKTGVLRLWLSSGHE